ncbi:hypothetical protein FH972_021098 [Carpinus fangiana]|uniref:Uncharacterized protein n=1 Tax=Carpinus fangiana TaxID=176857 RepID=A0A5N6KNX4_9ROSI|nr:hypothetical protein FH972_021098 [Carpinus fangiana]
MPLLSSRHRSSSSTSSTSVYAPPSPPPYAVSAITEPLSSLSLADTLSSLRLTDNAGKQDAMPPKPDECAAHLLLLAAIHRLKDEISNSNGVFGLDDTILDIPSDDDARAAIHDGLKQKRWAVYVARAADRYARWFNRSIPTRAQGPLRIAEFDVGGPFGHCIHAPEAAPLGLSRANLPPLDVLMVWHSHMLNPRAYLEDCVRAGKLALWSAGMPWGAVAQSIDATTLRYAPGEAARGLWEAGTLLMWDSLHDAPVRNVACRGCRRVMGVPASMAGEELVAAACAQGVSLAQLHDRLGEFGRGYYDKNFAAVCSGCGVTTNHDTMAVDKFLLDMRLLVEKDAPMPGTVLGSSGQTCNVDSSGLSKDMDSFPNRLLALGGNQYVLREINEGTGAKSISSIRAAFEFALEDKQLVTQANGGLGSKPRPASRVAIRKMFSRYWSNPSPFALDLAAAVHRQGTFIDKMQDIDWLHSPTLHTTTGRLVTKYERFFQILADDTSAMVVPTLDVDLAWHTHQCNPFAYYTYSVAKTRTQFVDHDDKVSEHKLSDAFAYTSKQYQKMTGEPYSECTCWYCEAIRESHSSSMGRLFDSKNARASALLHPGDARGRSPSPVRPGTPGGGASGEGVHISAHNAVRTVSTDQGYAVSVARQRERLSHYYEKACKRAVKSGRAPPKQASMQQWCGKAQKILAKHLREREHEGPYMTDPSLAGYQDIYLSNPACMSTIEGSAGNCCQGTLKLRESVYKASALCCSGIKGWPCRRIITTRFMYNEKHWGIMKERGIYPTGWGQDSSSKARKRLGDGRAEWRASAAGKCAAEGTFAGGSGVDPEVPRTSRVSVAGCLRLQPADSECVESTVTGQGSAWQAVPVSESCILNEAKIDATTWPDAGGHGSNLLVMGVLLASQRAGRLADRPGFDCRPNVLAHRTQRASSLQSFLLPGKNAAALPACGSTADILGRLRYLSTPSWRAGGRRKGFIKDFLDRGRGVRGLCEGACACACAEEAGFRRIVLPRPAGKQEITIKHREQQQQQQQQREIDCQLTPMALPSQEGSAEAAAFSPLGKSVRLCTLQVSLAKRRKLQSHGHKAAHQSQLVAPISGLRSTCAINAPSVWCWRVWQRVCACCSGGRSAVILTAETHFQPVDRTQGRGCSTHSYPPAAAGPCIAWPDGPQAAAAHPKLQAHAAKLRPTATPPGKRGKCGLSDGAVVATDLVPGASPLDSSASALLEIARLALGGGAPSASRLVVHWALRLSGQSYQPPASAPCVRVCRMWAHLTSVKYHILPRPRLVIVNDTLALDPAAPVPAIHSLLSPSLWLVCSIATATSPPLLPFPSPSPAGGVRNPLAAQHGIPDLLSSGFVHAPFLDDMSLPLDFKQTPAPPAPVQLTLPHPAPVDKAVSSGSNKRKRSAPASDPRPVKRVAPTTPRRPTGDAPVDTAAAAASPESDKKRNKLGYHRTSVACSKFRPDQPSCVRLTANVFRFQVIAAGARFAAWSPTTTRRAVAPIVYDSRRNAHSVP